MAETARTRSHANLKDPDKPRRRPTLFEAYRSGMLNENTLRELSDKIDRINEPPLTSATKPSITASHGKPDGIPHGETSGELPGIPPDQPSISLVAQPHISPSGIPHGMPDISPDKSPRISPSGESYGETILLTENQALLYECLKCLDGQFVMLPRIARALKASVDTLRSCIRKLRKVHLVSWSVENISGQNGMRITISARAYTLRGHKVSLHNKLAGIDYTQLGITHIPPTEFHQISHQMLHQVSYQTPHQVTDQICSSSKEQLLQGLILEGAFAHLSPQSLLPYLAHVETTEALQEFLDIANACVTAGNVGEASPIKNPQGFLIAQLKAGYINPPEGYKSRHVWAHEARNRQLQAELDELKRLKAEEEHLRFELFKERLTLEEHERLSREAEAQVDRRSPVSVERQLEVAREQLLKEWFKDTRVSTK
jgi:hypothetical protein